jgi:glycosyltransferase involved in cell wall biosynthesis
MAGRLRIVNTHFPAVDVNLFVYNAHDTIGTAIESVLSQTWPAVTLTVIDNASTDGTLDVVRDYMAAIPTMRLHCARVNGGAVVNCQRAFMFGDSDYILPKTADDLLAPDFIERAMAVLAAHPDCAMCHAGGLVFSGNGVMRGLYPDVHRLHAVGADPRARARHVMARYASAPSFWGIYRRDAVQRLSSFRYRAGWDHVVLAELALYGEIRHVPEPLYWRRDGGKPVGRIARDCTEAAQRGLGLDDDLADLRWLTPLITTAYAHVEMFAVARCDAADRAALMADAVEIFRRRWLSAMRQEAAAATAALLPAPIGQRPATVAAWRRHQRVQLLDGIRGILPDDRSLAAFDQADVSGPA